MHRKIIALAVCSIVFLLPHCLHAQTDTTFYIGAYVPGSPQNVADVGGNLWYWYTRLQGDRNPYQWIHDNVAPSVKLISSWRELFDYGYARGSAKSADVWPNRPNGNGWQWDRADSLGTDSGTVVKMERCLFLRMGSPQKN